MLLGVGWRLRLRQTLYALILQGGAVGALYITVFGAFRLYQLLPHILAFGLMLVICAASVELAVLQRALSLAMLASLGGYLAPLLLSTGGGSHIALFSYYLLLSLGILTISVWQPWRPLNLLGFVFSFGVAGLWGMNHYQPEDYLGCQPFLIANILIFGVLCLVLTLRARLPGERVIDGVLLFGPPLIGFSMQYLITRQWAFGPAFSALGFGLAYLLLAWAALKRYPSMGKMLAISGLALGAGMTTLTFTLVFAVLALAWLAAALIWRAEALWHSRLVQTTLALVWMLTALFVMLWSTRHRRRDTDANCGLFFALAT
ncbi:Predicted membrane protein [Serratia entomophila]|nr:Predicted membrane protein [Serratia entomophila]CAI1738714.1 Predicted membrane protein [Serratia entomophila]CAI1759389.1 Predicted membrane protein [Serratia entomophila]CAI1812391.1 Predicted membrane protein [Serratia entomophila]CAI1857214.1 Predicted membrane protein [Serratia entomophila]